jgi:hypothetical protein
MPVVRHHVRPLVAAFAIAIAFAAPAVAGERSSVPFSDADYWAFADRLMAVPDGEWSASRGVYVSAGGDASARVNSALLFTHAVAALSGHEGPTRQDARARTLVERLTAPPAWLGAGALAPDGLSTCWSNDLDRRSPQHMSLEPKVADALASAWRARAALGLSDAAAARIVATVSACAYSAAWRFPRRLANQINWNAEMYANAATVSGRPDLLLHDYRRHLARFAAGIARPMPGERSPNLGRGYQFHYNPGHSDGAARNLDAPEYANIVVHAIGHYDRALQLGMPPLPRASMRRMRAWVTRLLAGSWTHAGYLNWDTGEGSRRWHSAQYWAFAQQGLLAIATSPQFWARPEYGRWSKALFDRSLVLYRRLADEARTPLAPPHMFGVHTRMEDSECFCARMIANAARAVALGLGSLPAEDPPPMYAFDYDTGRLAVTTPRYSTAIVPDNRGAFAYGGIDPARLFGPGQVVAANVGGTPPGAFGIVVADARGREVLASQHARTRSLHLTRSPHGPLRHPRAYPAVPYAGPFALIEARGTIARRGLRIGAVHRFTRDAIESRWRVTCRRRCAGYRVRAHFPTWGAGAVIDAYRRDGVRVRLAGPGAHPDARVALSKVAVVTLGRGYVVIPISGPPGATLQAVPVAPEATNPSPGPSLAVALISRGRFAGRSLAVRIEPTR